MFVPEKNRIQFLAQAEITQFVNIKRKIIQCGCRYSQGKKISKCQMTMKEKTKFEKIQRMKKAKDLQLYEKIKK